MIQASDFLDTARHHSLSFFTGVPCSFLTPLINAVISDRHSRYVGAASEGEAVAIAAGAWLAGRDTVVMCQNSGLGNAVNPLTSLNWPFRIPTLLIVTWRGQPGLKDEPQHELMGEITGRMLDVMRIPHRLFPTHPAELGAALEAAARVMNQSRLPYALVMAKGSVAGSTLDNSALPPRRSCVSEEFRSGNLQPRRIDALERLIAELPSSAAVVATTGYCGRELFTLADRPQHIYQVGSLGGASAMGLGVALNVDRPVVVVDGDGAALMKMGNMATIGAQQPVNLLHVVIDNGAYESTGGQATASPIVDFPAVARACGYRYAATADSVTGFAQAVKRALALPGPRFIHVKVVPGTIDRLGRPTISPQEIALRFRGYLATIRRSDHVAQGSPVVDPWPADDLAHR
jgi:phosphonopyruvate decarboxylase